jgi:hypothetical protein
MNSVSQQMPMIDPTMSYLDRIPERNKVKIVTAELTMADDNLS